MLIIETTVFTKLVRSYLADDTYRQLQQYLATYPDAGRVIRGSGGVRKLRWAGPDTGKRGGFRVIYYWFVSGDKLLMLYIYPKTKQGNLTPTQIQQLKAVVQEEF